jgi:ferredoxin
MTFRAQESRGTPATAPAGGTARAAGLRLLARLDAAFDRLYGWRGNPLYHSGTLVVLLMAVLLVTGLYLLLFYRIGSPYASVEAINDQVWAGRWVRALHRYASAAVVVAIVVHALRLWLQGRSWGPRALAWLSGVGLLLLVLVCGWTGYVMVWDVHGQVLAQQGARLLDVLPLFSEPLGRAFTGERPLPGAFFFLKLFLHIALPVGLALLLWVHVSRVARPNLLPPRRILWGVSGLLVALSVLWPIRMDPPADLFAVPERVALDVFYGFWLPLARVVPPALMLALAVSAGLVLVLVPFLARPRTVSRPAPSVVDERRCTGCEQCALDCPYDAIRMVVRTDGRPYAVARVNAALCVSCGICAGSCAPMGVGPPGRTGRDQLDAARRLLADLPPAGDGVVVVACARAVGGLDADGRLDGAPVLPVDCGGSLHTSVIELALREGAAGVLVVACPPRDCWSREGPRWLEARVHENREAELKARVDRRRLRLVFLGAGRRAELSAALAAFRRDLAALVPEAPRDAATLLGLAGALPPLLDPECDRPAARAEPIAGGGP